jgi:hypothetical protein
MNISMLVLNVKFVPHASSMQRLFHFFLLGRHYREYLTMVFLLSLQTSLVAMLIVLLHLHIGCLGHHQHLSSANSYLVNTKD